MKTNKAKTKQTNGVYFEYENTVKLFGFGENIYVEIKVFFTDKTKFYNILKYTLPTHKSIQSHPGHMKDDIFRSLCLNISHPENIW